MPYGAIYLNNAYSNELCFYDKGKHTNIQMNLYLLYVVSLI